MPNTSITLKYLFLVITLTVSIKVVLLMREDKGTRSLFSLFGMGRNIRKKVKKAGNRLKMGNIYIFSLILLSSPAP
jgi:hypothetical protein